MKELNAKTRSRRGIFPLRWRVFAFLLWVPLVGGLMLPGCQPESVPLPEDQPYQLALPAGFPEMEVPANNQLTALRVELGKMLFYDPLLSKDSSLSCASCHLAEAGFADYNAVSVGIEGRKGVRNSPTLTNIGYHQNFFREGGSPTLEQQVLGPIENENEMGFNGALLVERLRGHTVYETYAQRAYDRELDLFVITRAIASFERTMLSGNAPYDRYQRGETDAMRAEAVAGMNLFFSERTQCAHCHSGFDFRSDNFANNGQVGSLEDQGRYRISLDSADIGLFTIPTLRNVALTAPYMIDGSLASLEEVVEHYNRGGNGHPNQSPYVQPLGLDETEKEALVAFLQSLTDTSFIHNPALLPTNK